ncbi:nuclear transport factor 2 family protein [Labilibacter marinus]|uniref:nuclear transport factor 2 family protein n=1 Tax=Labilibacter marinus TaxID=1477105 RepID=UPI00094F834E|nr:nuclear transport factor 2 family protein [Labilibacter marinus]
MKNLALVLLMAVTLFSCEDDNNPKEISNTQKVTELLKSIETGAKEPVSYINPNNYTQHNQGVADGLAGFGAALSALSDAAAADASLTPKVDVKRVFEDGNYVIAHTEYNFFGPKAGFDIFRFENGLIVEHWDNLQTIVTETASGRSMFDGPTVIKDLDKTETNRSLVEDLLQDVFLGEAPDKITDYISTEQYHQHNPGVKDGLAGLNEALTALAQAGMPMVYTKVHEVFAEGNFVLSVSEGVIMNEDVSFYDLFRVEDGKVVEHWDTVEKLTPSSEALNSNGKFNF